MWKLDIHWWCTLHIPNLSWFVEHDHGFSVLTIVKSSKMAQRKRNRLWPVSIRAHNSSLGPALFDIFNMMTVAHLPPKSRPMRKFFVPRFQMPLTEGHVFQLRGLGPPPLLAVLFAVPSRGRCLPSLWSLQPYDGAGVFNGTLYFCNTLPFTRRRPFEGNLAFTCWKIQC